MGNLISNKLLFLLLFRIDILQDTSLPQEPTTSEMLDMRKVYENERLTNRLVS